MVAGGGLGVVGDAAYATLMAKILVGYVQTDKIMKASTGSNVGIEPYQGSTLSETLWEISAQDTNGIVAAHGGNAGAALNSYNTLDFLAEGAAMTAMAYGANSMGAAPFGQPLAPRSIYSGNSSSTVLPSRVVMAQYDCSFSADTLVMTEDGLVPISEVTLSTPVLAYNEEAEEIGYYPVIAIWSHEDPVIVFLTIDGETIVTTPNHPFLTADGEWEQAANLQPGDEIRNAAWNTGTVEAITFTAIPQTMYNFTVRTAHTYFVGDEQWLVHNQCPPAISSYTGNSRRLQPDPNATGPHTTFRRDGTTGEINHYATWAPNPRNPSGFDLELRVDISLPYTFKGTI
ncbi:MAG: hypothetical protein HND44_24835 [Chloroflexi bacterium]|nr:hypothetical protein [Ardenticatenaceae bacterium]MBL1131642.1 hypothetical protein [Chloroflexota bacterium]NOG37760.1 hypothetical protein [Chloroflexota bacterium]